MQKNVRDGVLRDVIHCFFWSVKIVNRPIKYCKCWQSSDRRTSWFNKHIFLNKIPSHSKFTYFKRSYELFCDNFFFSISLSLLTLSLCTPALLFPTHPTPSIVLLCLINTFSNKIHSHLKSTYFKRSHEYIKLFSHSLPYQSPTPYTLHYRSLHSLHTLPPHTPPPNSTHRITNPHNHPPNHNQNQRARPQPLPTKHPFTTLSNPPHSTWQTMEPQAAERNINVPVLENVLNW